MKIEIAKVKQWREEIGATHLVVFANGEDGGQCVATHGLTEQNAQEAAKAGNNLKAALDWPDVLCHDKPLKRICKNCSFYKPDYGLYCMNGWTGNGTNGHCQYDIERGSHVRMPVKEDEKCVDFEPNA